jgi:acyl carrier protein
MDTRIKEAFEEALKLSKSELDGLSDVSSINTVSRWDSVGHLALIAALEKIFGVSITNFEAVELIDVAQIKQLLGSKGVTVSN